MGLTGMPSASTRRILCRAIAIGILLGGLAYSQARPSSPTLISFSPAQGTPSSTVSITFTGTNFVARSMSLIFTPSQGLTVTKLQVISPNQILAQVQIDASAQPGTRQMVLIDADKTLPSPAPFTIADPTQPGCTALAANCGPTGNPGPVIREFSPLQGTQGTTVAFTVTGANFTSPAALQFTPGAGLTVQSAKLVNKNEIQAQVSIAPNAPLGPRGVVLSMGNFHATASNTFTVVSGSIAHMSPMQILRVIPNQIAAGSQNVDLTLQGTNFVPGTQVTFTVGAGVPAAVFAAGPARYVNSTELHVTVSALSSALPGGRDISLQAPNQQAIAGKGMLNVQAVKLAGLPTVLKIPPIALQSPPEGVINLEAPRVQQQYEGGPVVVPLLDDDTVFQWQEQNPGTADYYELRIYAQDRKTLITKRTISGPNVAYYGKQVSLPPTYYRPDSAFLTEVEQRKFAVLADGHTQFIIDLHHLFWRVAGFHRYAKSGIMLRQMVQNVALTGNSQSKGGPQPGNVTPQPGETTDIEVEISGVWELGTTQAPTGLTCAGKGMGNGLQVVDVDQTQTDPNNYANDRWLLSGTVDLTNSPYSAHGTPKESGSGLVKTVNLMTFDNVFVDWGDGSVQPLSAIPTDNQTIDSRGIKFTLPDQITKQYALWHAYSSPNSYKIRVFQLSEADAQHVSASAVAASADGPVGSPFLQAAMLQKIAMPGSNSAPSSWQNSYQTMLMGGSASPGAGVSQVANDAYMIYCFPLTIVPVEDLAADGPLHLKSIDDPNYPGYDVVKPLKMEPKPFHDISGEETEKIQSAATRPALGPTQQQPKPLPQEKMEIRPGQLSPGGRAAGGQTPSGPVAICSTCDDGMVAESYIHFYGRGHVEVTWTVDGQQSQLDFDLGPSTHRKNLTRQDVDPGKKIVLIPIGGPGNGPIVDQSAPIDSQALPVKLVGMHSVKIEAQVVPEPSNPNIGSEVGRTLGLLASGIMAGGTGTSKGVFPAGVEQAKSLLNTLSAPPGSNLPPLKVGVLSPTKQSGSGLGAVQYINGALQAIVGKAASLGPDQYVASNPTEYQAVASDPKQPCKFLFAVSDGSFEIDGIQNHLKQNGTKYTGTGNLTVRLANSAHGGYDTYPPIPVKIDNWDVPDGLNVSAGTVLDVSPSQVLTQSVPRLKGTIDRLQGKAGGDLNATLSVTLNDDSLRQPGEIPVSWNGVTSVLHPTGDWIATGLTLPRTIIGWSAFQMQGSGVQLDLSHNAGAAACGVLGGADWVGINLPSLTVYPYTMNLVSGSSFQTQVQGWGVNDQGLCGSLQTGQFTAPVMAGSISFSSINATVQYSSLTATYNGLNVFVPFLNAHLTGNANLQSGGGKQASITFTFASTPVTKTFGNVAFTANHFSLTTLQGLWGVQADTAFTFAAENSTFAALKPIPFFFGMDGRGYLPSNSQAQDVPLGGSSHLGHTPVDLISAHLTVPTSGAQILAAQISTTVHLSEVMPSAPMQVNYELDQSGSNYTSTGPANSRVDVDVPYPAGQPASEAHIHPVYSGGANTEYSGSVDLTEIGGPSVTGEFRLGYQGGHDYWLTRVGFSLPSGVPIAPGLSLFKVQGGMGHNFPISAFENVGSLNAETPDVSQNSFLFMAGARIGTSDEFTCTVDGDLVIKTGGSDAGARMDFHSWILKAPDNGNGDFKGYFQYAGGNFDGRIWGRLDFMNNAAYLDLGSGPNDAAVDLHFGPSGPWHVDAGKQTGPRIRGHLLITDADMYMMLSPDGLSLGGGESIDLEAGDSSINGYIRGNVDMGLTVTPQPHIAGDFSASVSAGACVYVSTPLGNVGGCVNVGVSAQVHAEFAPLDVHASASVGTPVGDITVTVHL